MSFKPASRSEAFIKLALTGSSGSGKTYSSLLIARGLVGEQGKIALLDTENQSASLYSDLTKFDTDVLGAPYSVDKYITAILEAEKAKYDVLIIDSITHAWLQLLDDKSNMDARGGNSYTNWAKMTPIHQRFIDAVTQSKLHIISTIRSKQDYVIEQNEKGKAVPKKIGLAPVQREGVEYEYTTVLDLDISHLAVASKDRTGMFSTTMPFVITLDTGVKIKEWLKNGLTAVSKLDEIKQAINSVTSLSQLIDLTSIVGKMKLTDSELEVVKQDIQLKKSKIGA